ncbi:DUF3613 domain-containing protein [Spongiibacter tropicus]|uniref:DUF3613 domain-containing protein n=1 Tax=Spongiibacter tropicus TaxID=454602 RepID=UPI003A9A3B9C
MPKKLTLIAFSLLVSTTVLADENKPDFSSDSPVTRAMAAQRSGELSSDKDQNLSGKARSASYKRYVESFSHPIPESFIDTGFKNGK